MTDGEGLTREQASGILRLVINRPDRLNALDGATTTLLTAALGDAAADESVRAVVITGSGRAFCSGADLTEVSADGADPDAIMDRANALLTAVLDAPVPVIARVNGPAVGIGMSLALAADLTYAATDAYFLQPFLSIGLMPDGGSSLLLAAALGRARANELVLLGERLPAPEAAETGLITRCAASLDELDRLVDEAAHRCADAPPRAFALTKEALREATLSGIRDALSREGRGQRELLGSPEFARRARAALGRVSTTP